MSSPRRAPEFFSAWPLLAVALLALNDHLLKATFHNTLTGKLSDFAGCFFLPLYVSALLGLLTRWSPQRRVLLGALATLAIFVPIKLSRSAADLQCRALERVALPLGFGAQHVVSDPTDLIALPMVALAVFHSRKVNPCAVASNC